MVHSRYTRSVVGSTAVLVLSACAIGNGANGSGSETLGSRGESATALLADPAHTIRPSGPAQKSYGGPIPERRPQRFEAVLDQNLEFVADPRLDSVARDLVSLIDRYAVVPHGAVEFLMEHYGVAEPVPEVVTLKRGAMSPEELAFSVARAVNEETESRRPSTYGAAALRTESGYTVVVLLVRYRVEMAPLRRWLTTREVIEFRGALPAGFRKPTIYRTGPGGSVEDPVVVTQGRKFHGAFECKKGRNQVELIGEGKLGVTVLANFPVYCGVKPPRALALDLVTETDSEDLDELARSMFELANRERVRVGLRPLLWSNQAARVSVAHSEDMREADFVGHVSPNTGGPADRVRAAGVKVSLVLENVARAATLRASHEGLMNSPGHRANILSAEATHLGVGVRRHENGELLTTQVFLRVPTAIDVKDARAQLLRTVGLRRRAQRLRAWNRDPVLQQAAMSHARALARNKGSAPQPKPRGLEGRYRQLITAVEVVGSVDDFVGKSIERKHPGGYGIGVAQGEHQELGVNVLYVVILIGVPVATG